MAAIVVRSILAVSASAYEEAASVMGPENAAAVMACILQRGGRINSAGGYLRDLTRRAERGEFALGPMLMALLRSEDRFKVLLEARGEQVNVGKEPGVSARQNGGR